MYLTNRLAHTQIKSFLQTAVNWVASVGGPHLNWKIISKWCPRLGRPDVLAYGGSVLGVGLATVFTHVVSPLQAVPTLPFTAAVVMAAWLGGRGPAALAIVLSALAVDYFFLAPIGYVRSSVNAVVCVLNFTFVAGLVCYLQENFKRIAAALRQANDIFETRVQQRTDELAKANESLSAEIEERRRAEAVLKESEAKLRVSVGTTEAALKEKEILLRELQHRVKNNLQVITSLLSLQCGKLHDQTSRELFKECQQRIRAIALVHEKLYRAPSLGDLDLASYFRDLVQNLLRCYCVKSGDVKPRIIVEEASVGIDHLILCGLIVNELVCNALKYAFPPGRSGEICVELRRIGGQVSLRVADDGVGGLPSGVLSVNGVGQQIVKALVDQLSGKLEWANGRGTSATVTFLEMK